MGPVNSGDQLMLAYVCEEGVAIVLFIVVYTGSQGCHLFPF